MVWLCFPCVFDRMCVSVCVCGVCEGVMCVIVYYESNLGWDKESQGFSNTERFINPYLTSDGGLPRRVHFCAPHIRTVIIKVFVWKGE